MSLTSTPSVVRDRPRGLDRVGEAVVLSGVEVGEYGYGPLRMTQWTFNGYAVSLTDDGATGHAALKLYDFPDGAIWIHSAVTDIDYSAIGGSAGNLQLSLGTTATADATLSSTDADIMAASSASAANGNKQALTNSLLDGTGTAKDIYLNIGTSGDPGSGATVTITGTITVMWALVGDY